MPVPPGVKATSAGGRTWVPAPCTLRPYLSPCPCSPGSQPVSQGAARGRGAGPRRRVLLSPSHGEGRQGTGGPNIGRSPALPPASRPHPLTPHAQDARALPALSPPQTAVWAAGRWTRPLPVPGWPCPVPDAVCPCSLPPATPGLLFPDIEQTTFLTWNYYGPRNDTNVTGVAGRMRPLPPHVHPGRGPRPRAQTPSARLRGPGAGLVSKWPPPCFPSPTSCREEAAARIWPHPATANCCRTAAAGNGALSVILSS